MKTAVQNIAPGKVIDYHGEPCLVLEHRKDGTLLLHLEQINYDKCVNCGIHEAIMAYEDNTFFEILAQELALRDMDDPPITEENYDEVMSRMDEYLGEFEQHGTDNITVDME